MHPLLKLTGGAVAIGALGLGYAAGVEVRAFTTRHVQVPNLPPGSPDLRVLHLSDLHAVPTQRKKLAWVASLAELEPDLIVNTGDNLAHQQAVPPVVGALEPFLDLPGVFVLGSNDYWAPVPKNPAMYLTGPSSGRVKHKQRLPTEDLRAELTRGGWLDLDNARGSLVVKGLRIDFAGVDDPHLGLDRYDVVAGPAAKEADLRLGVLHAPYVRLLNRFAGDGYDLIFAGHTHGGQLCLPGLGALVTNCDIEPGRARGLHRHPAASAPGDAGSSWLHVSAGLGTSPYAPVRFCCRPEATLLTLTSTHA